MSDKQTTLKQKSGFNWPGLLNTLSPVIALLLVFELFVLIAPASFATLRNLETIARQTTIVGVAALGMTMVIISGGIDLSVGSIVALSTVVIAWLLQNENAGINPQIAAIGSVAQAFFGIISFVLTTKQLLHIGMNRLIAVIGGLAAAAFCSLISGKLIVLFILFGSKNPLGAAIGGVAAAAFFGLLSGILITRLRVVPFIVTLGMMLVVRGAAKGIGHEQKIDVDPQRLKWLDDLLASVPPERSWMLLPAGVWIMIILAIAMAALLRYTRLGRHTFAIGSNEQTARLCGVAVERVKVLVYSLGGLFGGLAGLMQFSRLTVGDPTVAVGLELNVIAAVVIGGGSLNGGEGSILGTMVGALIMTVIASGCTQRGYPNWVQEIITGAIIVIAVALDRLRHRRTA
jgi:ribose transport system permease protein